MSTFSPWLGDGLATAAGVAAAMGGFAYASLYPASCLFGQSLIAPRKPGELALTFDDGPNPTVTPRLLDLLAEHKVPATFFLLGSHAATQHDLVRRIAAEGHLIGNHSWSHPNLALCSGNRILSELTSTCDALEQITGAPVKFFRPPFGARRPATLRIARELGMVPVLWNAMTSDWSQTSPQRIAQQLIRKIDALTRQGLAANIVLHDSGHLDQAARREPSLAAAGQIAERYKATHQFVRVDAWG